jgi:GDP-L-fucose synthase
LCESYTRQHGSDFISAMPTNLYGPNDNYDLNNSHVLPALIRKFHEAKINEAEEVVIWGSGTPMREFLHVDDLAAGCYFLMKNYSGIGLLNIGTGEDIAIKDLALLIKEIVGFEGKLTLDSSKPDGTPRKLTDCTRIHDLGWKHQIELREGITSVYEQFQKDYSRIAASGR